MTELERKALMGDREAQRECTENGIILPCPCCKGNARVRYIGNNSGPLGYTSDVYYRSKPGFIMCDKCGMSTSKMSYVYRALAKWNTRPAPPIGRCGECKHFINMECTNEALSTDHEGGASYSLNFDEYDFCSYFEPKEREWNEE